VSRDIGDRRDIEGLLRAFYRRAFTDELIGPIFVDVAKLDLEAHLPIMCDFWETVLFRTGSYKRNAFRVHADLHARFALQPLHFARWVTLWIETVDSRHAGPHAELAKLRAGRIADSIGRRLISGPRPS
jgi:hemoglobin